jgi:hypothetical protein
MNPLSPQPRTDRTHYQELGRLRVWRQQTYGIWFAAEVIRRKRKFRHFALIPASFRGLTERNRFGVWMMWHAPEPPWAAILRALVVQLPHRRSPARWKRRRPWRPASEGSQGRATCRGWRAPAVLLVTPALDTFSTSASPTTRGLAWRGSYWPPAWRIREQRLCQAFVE